MSAVVRYLKLYPHKGEEVTPEEFVAELDDILVRAYRAPRDAEVLYEDLDEVSGRKLDPTAEYGVTGTGSVPEGVVLRITIDYPSSEVRS